jgi:hypothetical protein
MMVVVVMVVMLMRFMDVVCSVIIICLSCIPILVKVSGQLSQRIFDFSPQRGAFTSGCLRIYFIPDRVGIPPQTRSFIHNKN